MSKLTNQSHFSYLHCQNKLSGVKFYISYKLILKVYIEKSFPVESGNKIWQPWRVNLIKVKITSTSRVINLPTIHRTIREKLCRNIQAKQPENLSNGESLSNSVCQRRLSAPNIQNNSQIKFQNDNQTIKSYPISGMISPVTVPLVVHATHIPQSGIISTGGGNTSIRYKLPATTR